MVIGHEPLGVVAEVGSDVASIPKGDRVVVPTHICCGFCYNCVRGYSSSCLTTNPGSVGAAYGYPGMGPYRGAQTELVRIPFADANCRRLPGEVGDQWEHDFVLLADAYPTAYHATQLAQVSTGDSVAIFGAGSIGLLAAYCAQMRGATEVYVVDYIPERLAKAGELGAIPIDFRVGDPVDQILEQRSRLRKGSGATWRGEESMGRDPDERYNTQLRDLIISGRAKPSRIVSHRLPLSQAPAAFQKFDQRIDGYIKVILDPAES